MLYLLETENSPQQKFKEFVSQNNGTIAIETTDDHSTYHFDIAVTEFKNALTSFAQLFINPVVFIHDEIKSELEQIDCTCENKENDKLEVIQLFKSTIDCNYQILDKKGTSYINVRSVPKVPEPILNNIGEYMQKFYNDHYSSHIMSLCVLSNGM